MEWLITAFAVTLVFIVFEMQAYTIPTGSMADTLKGAHFRLRCYECGYRYDHEFIPQYYGMKRNVTPGLNVGIRPKQPRCPSCGHYLESGERLPVVKGDQIFVLKCIYQFVKPKRWDVVVFKNPLNPAENYIKRMIAGPGEMVQIIDGDVYIDGRIARKPARVQEEMWMCVYSNDNQPANPERTPRPGSRSGKPEFRKNRQTREMDPGLSHEIKTGSHPGTGLWTGILSQSTGSPGASMHRAGFLPCIH